MWWLGKFYLSIKTYFRKKYKKACLFRHAFFSFLYWRNLFGKTKVNSAKKQFEKGIIQLNFTQNG